RFGNRDGRDRRQRSRDGEQHYPPAVLSHSTSLLAAGRLADGGFPPVSARRWVGGVGGVPAPPESRGCPLDGKDSTLDQRDVPLESVDEAPCGQLESEHGSLRGRLRRYRRVRDDPRTRTGFARPLVRSRSRRSTALMYRASSCSSDPWSLLAPRRVRASVIRCFPASRFSL